MTSIRNHLRKWLGVDEWALHQMYSRESIDEKLEVFSETLNKFSEVECSACQKLIRTYPLGGGYHRLFDGTILCPSCGEKHSKGDLK